jgi:hypothetical protein
LGWRGESGQPERPTSSTLVDLELQPFGGKAVESPADFLRLCFEKFDKLVHANDGAAFGCVSRFVASGRDQTSERVLEAIDLALAERERESDRHHRRVIGMLRFLDVTHGLSCRCSLSRIAPLVAPGGYRRTLGAEPFGPTPYARGAPFRGGREHHRGDTARPGF